ncbi:hypothetical protein BN381_610014 [Candidatus Microthrix parvicella RN1]|uniref:Uncharacterized protein n=1 Tax=Candidatus Neomicrothrix parvicella RN1 TaxID=1229780 RepID=R4Z3H8_9ACTN|nr:hypothetical protein BN381_610014 [Candidatus Microthrix parvicella RN1]
MNSMSSGDRRAFAQSGTGFLSRLYWVIGPKRLHDLPSLVALFTAKRPGNRNHLSSHRTA